MLLDDLHSLVKHGSEMPLDFWLDDLLAKKDNLLSGLKKVESSLEAGTDAQKSILKLIQVLNRPKPDEQELTKSLLFIPSLFRDKGFEKYADLLVDYAACAAEFSANAGKNKAFEKSRGQQKAKLKPEQQKAHDLELFGQGGMFYCLEYYLTLYKKIADAQTEQEKKIFIESELMKVDGADLPGLWIDFKRNEVLEKFIWLILDDAERNRLTQAFFKAKKAFMGIQRQCDKKGKCEFTYLPTTLPQAVDALRQLILVMLNSFQAMNIERLGSKFLAPYGKEALLSDLYKLI